VVAAMRGGSKQQNVITRIPPRSVSLCFMFRIRCRHPMGLGDDHKVPVDLAQAGKHVCSFCKVERPDRLWPFDSF